LTSSNLEIFDLVFRLIFDYDISQGALMNKPDNSDGSRGQLTAEQILATYFKFNPLGFEFGKPVKPILLPHLGLSKNEFQWFSGYLVRPLGFFFTS
jgi:hypothetical protein